jgi:Flp pilus assembly protein TadG
MVEFALVLPVFLLVLLGMVDMGKAISYWNDQTHLANEAARFAVVNSAPTPGLSIETYIKNQAVTPELKNGGTGDGTVDSPGIVVKFCFPNGAAAHNIGDPVKVTVTSTYRWFGYLGGVATSKMVGTSTMRLEKAWSAATANYDKTGPTAC